MSLRGQFLQFVLSVSNRMALMKWLESELRLRAGKLDEAVQEFLVSKELELVLRAGGHLLLEQSAAVLHILQKVEK
jgi:hypothetical protein